MHQGEAAHQTLVGEVREEPGQLVRRQHPLVGDGPRRERGEVALLDLVLGALAQDERQAVERERRVGTVDPHLGLRGHEDLVHTRAAPRSETEPSEESSTGRSRHPRTDQPLVVGELLDRGPRGRRGLRIAREEGDPGRVPARLGQVEGDLAGVEVVRDLEQDPRSVPAVLLAAGRPSVCEVLERRDRLEHQLVRTAASEVGHEGHAAGVVLEAGVVEARSVGGRGADTVGGVVEGAVVGGQIESLQREKGSTRLGRRWPCAVRKVYTRVSPAEAPHGSGTDEGVDDNTFHSAPHTPPRPGTVHEWDARSMGG